jgi:hypothetical protein
VDAAAAGQHRLLLSSDDHALVGPNIVSKDEIRVDVGTSYETNRWFEPATNLNRHQTYPERNITCRICLTAEYNCIAEINWLLSDG